MARSSISRESASNTGRRLRRPGRPSGRATGRCPSREGRTSDGTSRPTRSRAALGLALLACGLVAGCGGNRASVRGTVTFGEQPVNGGRIFFLPEGDPAGRPAVHATIEQGQYRLPAAQGPALGRHRVEIVWHKTPPGKRAPADPGLVTDDMQQVIPDAYNSKTTLFVDVQRGSNTFDFALKERP